MKYPKEFYEAEQRWLIPPEYKEKEKEIKKCENCGLELTEEELLEDYDGLCEWCFKEVFEYE